MRSTLRSVFLLIGLHLTACGTPPAAEVDAPIQIEFRLATTAPVPGTTEMIPLGAERPVWVYPDAAVTRDDIAHASMDEDTFGNPAVRLEMTDEGAQRLEALTDGHLDAPVAVFVDGTLVLAPFVRSRMSRQMMIFSDPTGIDKDVCRSIVARINEE